MSRRIDNADEAVNEIGIIVPGGDIAGFKDGLECRAVLCGHTHPMDIAERFCPEIAAGGFTRHDHLIAFYVRIRALMSANDKILNFGAGRGKSSDDLVPFRRELMDLRGERRKVTGADIDPIVLENPTVDEAVCLHGSGRLPFEDETFDLIVSDWTFEHLKDPRFAASELMRTLKPGGWICARTPHRWSYFAVAAQVIPSRLHGRILKHTSPHRKSVDIFPTVYRLNTLAAIRRHFPGLENYSFLYAGRPGYHANSVTLWRLFSAYNTIIKPTLLVFLRKPLTPDS